MLFRSFRPDDDRIRLALDIAEKEGLDFTFEKTTLSDDAHPNTVRITLDRAHRHHSLIGASIGAGRIRITEIDGYPVEVSGSHHTIVLVAEDIKGSIARIATLLAEDGVNIATLRLTRQQRGGDAFMVIEVDEEPGEKVDRKSTRLNSSHTDISRMPSSA